MQVPAGEGRAEGSINLCSVSHIAFQAVTASRSKLTHAMEAVCPPCPGSSLAGYSQATLERIEEKVTWKGSTEQYKKEDIILLKVFVFLSSQEKNNNKPHYFLINASYFQASFCVLRGSEEPEIRPAPITTREDQVGEKIRCWELNERMLTAILTSQVHSTPSHLK